MLIKCNSCGAGNRVDTASVGKDSRPVCGRCRKALPLGGKPIHLTDSNFAESVERSRLPFLVDLWAEWCGPCRIIAPVIEQLSGDLAGRAFVGKLDVDSNPATAARLHVQSIPTLIVWKDGREVERMIGAQSRDAILARLSPHI